MAFPPRKSRLVLLTGLVLVIMLVTHMMPGDYSLPPLLLSPNPPAAGGQPPQSPSHDGTTSSASWTSQFDWSKAKLFHPPESIKPMPTGPPRKLGRVQAPDDAFIHDDETRNRQRAVRDAFKKSYNAYRTHAWMKDELTPVSGSFKNPFGGWAATLVDALDTLWIMDLRDEFHEAARAVGGIDWSVTDDSAANLFETTIRHLGGLLSAYDLGGDGLLLNKAVQLGEMLYHAFDTPNRLPGFWFNYRDARSGALTAGVDDPSASPASLCVEFTRLSQITGDPKFYDATDRVTRFLERTQNDTLLPGMWPVRLDFRNEAARSGAFSLGAMADSLYEYLPKMHALTGGLDPVYEQMYRASMDTAARNLLFRPMLPGEDDVLFSGDFHARGSSAAELVPQSQHLTCFAGAMFALGGRLFSIDEHVSLGERLARGCGWAYSAFPTGVMPEIFTLIPCNDTSECPWDEAAWRSLGDENLPRGFVGVKDPQYQLRPEAIESLFVLYRVTANRELQDTAWDMFRAILASTETTHAYSAISDVTTSGETKKLDSMEVRHAEPPEPPNPLRPLKRK
ncbi:Glycoside hydrolase, family 47 [Metarhizium album ARSEF 1941]|uniref:alpha-1,2-Mannosidase n=1 Tax=Metarhizium album (strain ARSEF 1941) TaxID=1081103 RepID=A0A0B2X5E7_METAS|nr:Glycoside hydrolase, family 47 [Metarhizium album ARSEF 1941]KHO00675.1 Glycoside hydrolase, family 47 [Metarhizium album ARSEF 1941]